jgi:hypothetical protein
LCTATLETLKTILIKKDEEISKLNIIISEQEYVIATFKFDDDSRNTEINENKKRIRFIDTLNMK